MRICAAQQADTSTELTKDYMKSNRKEFKELQNSPEFTLLTLKFGKIPYSMFERYKEYYEKEGPPTTFEYFISKRLYIPRLKRAKRTPCNPDF